MRIVLEDEEGRIVSESFGAGESAWELRKQGRGWTMVERDDVDWAMLADLRRPEDEQAALLPSTASEEAETGQDGNASPSMQWGSWVRDRMMLPEEPAETSARRRYLHALLVSRKTPELSDNTAAESSQRVPCHRRPGGRGGCEDAGGDPAAEGEMLGADNVVPDGLSQETLVWPEPVRHVADVLERQGAHAGDTGHERERSPKSLLHLNRRPPSSWTGSPISPTVPTCRSRDV